MSKLVQAGKQLPKSLQPLIKRSFGLLEKQFYLKGIRTIPANQQPHFTIIGLPKAATGWLTTTLKRHEDFHYGSSWFSNRGEINYFSRYFHYPLSYYLGAFKEGEDKFRFEKSPGYAAMPYWKIQLVKALFPKIKAILILRDPVERAWSHAKMILSKKGKVDLTQVPDKKYYALFERFAYKFDYSLIVDNWRKVFSDDFMIVDYDKVKESPNIVLDEVSQFIGFNKKIDFTASNSNKNATENYRLPEHFSYYLQELNKQNIDFYNNYFEKDSF